MKNKLKEVLLSFPVLGFPMLSLAILPIPIHTYPTLVWNTAPAVHVTGNAMRATELYKQCRPDCVSPIHEGTRV